MRTLAGVASGPVSLSNLYGKSNESFWYATFGSTVVNFLILGTDSSGNIYASATSAVFKWDRDGALIWARNVSGPFINGGWIDASGNVYLAGAYYSSNYYGWLAKLDASGTLQWQRSLNGSGQDLWYNAAVYASGNVYVAGYSTSSGGSGNADALIAKYNSAGTLLWQRSIGGSGNEYVSQMALSPDGSLLVLSGNTSTSTAGNTDALITVLNTATLSFYRPQSKWLEYPGITVLPFSNYEQCIRNLVSRFGGAEHLLDLPHLNATQAEPSQLTPDQRAMVQTFYEPDMVYEARVIAL